MKNENKSDEDIVKFVNHGDIEHFKIIVSRYQNHIFSIGMRFFKNTEDSSDFVQEVFIKAFKNLESYKGWSPFRFWLTRIAYNHGINEKNAKKVESDVSDSESAIDETPEAVHVKEEVKELLLNAIEKLPERYKICLDFYFFLELTYVQISDITGFPVNTIKSNVLRAKQILRDSLRGTIAEEYHEV